MTKELQDHVWSILPKEFKEEVKEIYSNAITYHPCGYNHKTDLLKYLFGRHNLTSDAEGEEMLCVKALKVREMYALNEKILYLDSTHKGAILLKKKLTDLFGSKCLHDELNEDNSPDPIGQLIHEPTMTTINVYKPISRFKRIMLRWCFGLKYEKI